MDCQHCYLNTHEIDVVKQFKKYEWIGSLDRGNPACRYYSIVSSDSLDFFARTARITKFCFKKVENRRSYYFILAIQPVIVTRDSLSEDKDRRHYL